MFDKRHILRDLKTHLQSNLNNSVQSVILFGSQARGDAKEDSDFDILILLNTDYSGEDENHILDLCYDIDLKYEILIDVHLLSNNELNLLRGKQPIYINAINNGIYV